MGLTEIEKSKLQLFSNVKLDRQQTETVIGRKLTNKEWKVISKDYRKIFTPIAKQAAKIARMKNYTKFKNENYFKPTLTRVAAQAALKGRRRLLWKTPEAVDKYHFVKSLFKDSEDQYEIRKIAEYYSDRYRTRVSRWRILGSVNLFNIHRVMVDLVAKMCENLPANARIQVSLNIANSDRQPHTNLLSRNDMSNLLTEWVNYFIDYYDLDIEDITFKIIAVEIPQGAGRKVNAIINLDDKRCITRINNSDSLCLVRSIIVGLSYNKTKLQETFKEKLTEKEVGDINYRKQEKTKVNEGIFSESEIKYLRQGGERKLQTVLAKAFHRIYEIPIKEPGNDLGDIKLIEDKLNVEIQVYGLDTRQIYAGVIKSDKIYLILSQNHYDVISKLPAFLGTNERTWGTNEKLKCWACKNPTKCNEETKTKCNTCGKVFYSKNCHDNHIKNKICIEHSYVCQACFKVFKVKIRKREDHRCDEVYCSNCEDWYIGEHKCYMKRLDLKQSDDKYIFFDFETMQASENKHVVNFCVAQYFNGDERVFYTTDDFCKWVFNKRHKGYTCIAHYGKGYDFQFVQEWLVAHTLTAKPDVLMNGQKILQLEVKRDYNIRFIDSISFTLQPLRDFPKTFGLEELAKGYFPHEFNSSSNQTYVGPYPDKKYYGYDGMTKKAKEEFDKWFFTVQDKVFNFREEMYKYCKSDVDILRRGCLKLRELFLKTSGIDPFRYITIASVCQAIYRNEFLPENTIGIVNETPTDTYSIKSIKWLKYVSQNRNIAVRHACNEGEQKLTISGKSLKVDGFCKVTNTVYQFHGCYYHGCKECYNDLTVNTTNGMYMYRLYEKTIKIDKAIKEAGYNLETIWEHEFDKNKEMKSISVGEYDLIEPPKIRESFFGGRCEPIKLLYDAKPKGKKGRYIDICSLYPTVQFYDKYPTGHPVKIIKPEVYDPSWFGFIYCKVLPPRALYQPVLPYKQKTKQAHKLLFGLCRTCMQNIDLKCTHRKNVKCKDDCKTTNCGNCKSARKLAKRICDICYNVRNGECFHTDEERCLTGFWCTNEMEKALEKGYQIQKIYEVWHFEGTSSELWKGYIRKFLKIKLETSKFDCSEEEYRAKARKLGIELDTLEYNPGLRFIAKICLNSLWGKFGQVPKHRQNKYIENEADFYKIVLDDKLESLSLSFLNDSTVYVSYECKNEFVKQNYNTNIYIACFTTSWARLRLYDMIDILGKNVCYMDTDSVVYIEEESNEYVFRKYIGDSLGEWTDELEGKHIDFWACAQSKDYGYIKSDGEYKGKIKGFRVTAETEEKMTHEARVKLIKGSIRNVDINYDQFTIINSKIFTKSLTKQWGFHFDKRRILYRNDDEIDTVPYGF